jgi:hypothetical protein
VIDEDTPPPRIVSHPRRHNFGESPATDGFFADRKRRDPNTFSTEDPARLWVLGSSKMSQPLNCGWAFCILEPHLLSALSSSGADVIRELLSDGSLGNEITSVAELLSHLKPLTADTASDRFLRELLNARPLDSAFIESVLILAFLPTLHATVRRVGKQQSGLSQEGIVPHTLTVLLEYPRSGELNSRQLRFAFAISPAVQTQGL